MQHEAHGTTLHPGHFISEELQKRSWTQVDLAFITDKSEAQINQLLKGRKAIDADLAVILEDAFGMPAAFFVNLENAYQLSIAKPAPASVKKKAQWQSKYPVREMLKRGWIEEDDPTLLDLQMLRFFERSKVGEVPLMGNGDSTYDVSMAAKKTNPLKPTSAEELAWLYRVRQIAKTVDAPSYSASEIPACIEKLKSLLSSREDVSYVPSLLKEYGIRFVVVETLPKAKIDGVCTWIDDQPVIGITNRYDRLDNFWFVIRHELEHVIHRHGFERGYTPIDCLDNEGRMTDDSVEEEERIANEAASEFCVSRTQLNSFIERKQPYMSEKDVIGFAGRLEVHPAIAVGQLQFALQKWSFLRKYLATNVAGVREILLSEVESENFTSLDGWGHRAITQL